jgi:glutamate/tyrosine decarboxylase-like PLP-dependent enzyme
MALQNFGLSGYRQLIEHDIRMARALASTMRAQPNFQVLEPQCLSIVCLRYVPKQIQAESEPCNRLNSAILERVQLGGRTFLSSTEIDGTFWLRACFVNPRTREDDLAIVADALQEAAEFCSAHLT